MTALVPPSPAVARTRELAYETVAAVLEDVLFDGGLRISPLGPAWSRDVDAHVRRVPDPVMLEAAGWVGLDALLRRLGYHADGRWAVVLADEVIGAADLHCGTPPDPVHAVLERVRRQGYLGAREAAELEQLRGQGYAVPRTPHSRNPPVVRRCRAAIRNRLRPREVVEIICADASDRSSLSARLVDDLTRAGVPASRARAQEMNSEEDAECRSVRPAQTRRRKTVRRLGAWLALQQSRGVVVVDRKLPAATDAEGFEEQSRRGLNARVGGAIALPLALARVVLEDPPGTGRVSSEPGVSEDERSLTSEPATLTLDAARPVAELSLAVVRHLARVSRA